ARHAAHAERPHRAARTPPAHAPRVLPRVLRVVALALALVLAGAGVARADDCEFEGVSGSLRSPITIEDGSGALVANAFAGEQFGVPDDLNAWRIALPAHGHGTQRSIGHALSPSLVRGLQAVRWIPGRGIVAGTRVLVPGLPFPGYAGVAAVKADDGTLT